MDPREIHKQTGTYWDSITSWYAEKDEAEVTAKLLPQDFALLAHKP